MTSCAEGEAWRQKGVETMKKRKPDCGASRLRGFFLVAAQRFKVRTKPVPPARYASLNPKESGALKLMLQ